MYGTSLDFAPGYRNGFLIDILSSPKKSIQYTA